MGATTITQEFACPIAPALMFTALIVESNNLIPKLLPHFIKSVDLIQGDGGSSSIEQVNFTEVSHFNYVKHRIDELEPANYMCRYTMIKGDALGGKLESIDYEVKFEPASGGGSICKLTSKYNMKEDFRVDEEDIRGGKEKTMVIHKVP